MQDSAHVELGAGLGRLLMGLKADAVSGAGAVVGAAAHLWRL